MEAQNNQVHLAEGDGQHGPAQGALKPCPFCGYVMPLDEGDNLIDALYPSNIFWRMGDEGYKHYATEKESRPDDNECWKLRCECCQAQVSGDSREEAISAWNRRSDSDGPTMRRGSRGDGRDWMGTMRECLEDAREAASVEARWRDEAWAEVKRLRELLRRIRGWDALDIPGSDGPFWQREIDKTPAE